MRISLFRNSVFSVSALTAALALVLISCAGRYDKYSEILKVKPKIFPDYTDVTIPVNIAPLNFEIKDAAHITAQVTLDGKEVFNLKGDRTIEFPLDRWKDVLKRAAGKDLIVTVTAWTEKAPEGIRYAPFKISVAKDETDPWIAYRLIPPSYELWNRMGIYQRNITEFDQQPIIKNSQNNKGCVNCHNFHLYDPKTWVFHARGKGGSTILTINGKTRKLPIEKMGPQKSATYPYWHPSGRYIVFSSNKTRQTFYGISHDKIEVFDMNSDIIIYDAKADSVVTDPRFLNSDDWETFPSFSPDGKYLYFCTAHLDITRQQRQKMQDYFEYMKYALIRVPFDVKTGKLGVAVDTIYSPQKEGGSVSFPRISPDGKYILYTEAQCATFPIQHVEADLKMKELATLKPIDTKILNSKYSDSYHSWSSNGRWIVFSSKRVDGKYTRLFFSYFGKDGKFTKPFMLPQKDPEQNGALLYAYNIPEFIKGKVEFPREEAAKLFKVN